MPINIPGIQALARIGQLFNPRNEMPTMTPSMNRQPFEPLQPTNYDFDVDAEIARIYQPRSQMRDLAEQMLQQFPQRDPNPSKWRRFGAVLAGMGSKDPIETSDRFMNYHYYKDAADWKARFDPLAKAADDERLANISERQLARETVSAKQNQMKIEETNRKNVESERTRRMRAEVYAWSKEHPNMHFESRGNQVYGINPATGEEVLMRDPDTGQPIPGALFAQRELQELRGRQALERANVAAGTSRANTATAGWQIVEEQQPDGTFKSYLLNPRTNQRRELPPDTTPETPPGRTTRTPTTPRPPTPRGAASTTPTQNAREIYNNAQRVRMEQPGWAQYIILGPSSTVTLHPRTPPTIAKQIQDAIYGQRPAPSPGGTTGRGAQNQGGGTVRMIKDGKEYDIPSNMVAAAEKDGLKRK